MRVPILLADYPAGGFTGILIIAATIGMVLLCLFVGWTLKATESSSVVRRWFMAAGICVVLCVILLIVVSHLGEHLHLP